MLSLTSLTGKLDALLGDKGGLLERGRGNDGEGPAEEAFRGESLPEAARGIPDFKCNDGADVVRGGVYHSPKPLRYVGTMF